MCRICNLTNTWMIDRTTLQVWILSELHLYLLLCQWIFFGIWLVSSTCPEGTCIPGKTDMWRVAHAVIHMFVEPWLPNWYFEDLWTVQLHDWQFDDVVAIEITTVQTCNLSTTHLDSLLWNLLESDLSGPAQLASCTSKSRVIVRSVHASVIYLLVVKTHKVLTCTESAPSEYLTTSQCLSALSWLRWKNINERTYCSHTTTVTTWWISTLMSN